MRIPTYRRRRIRGYEYGYVTLRDRKTGKRKDYELGPYADPASRERYAQLIVQWERADRRLLGQAEPVPTGLTVAQLCAQYFDAACAAFSSDHRAGVRTAFRALRALYGSEPAAAIGPKRLREYRTSLKRLCRGTINARVQMIVRMYRWGVSEELVPETVHRALATLRPLRQGEGRDPAPVECVPDVLIAAVRPHLTLMVATMLEVQLVSGMRPGELCRMRPCDLDIRRPVWLYRPVKHKTAWRGKVRTVPLGPRAQRLIGLFLAQTAVSGYIFDPRRAMAAQIRPRVTPLSCGNKRTGRINPRIGERYSVGAYRRAVQRACDRAFPLPAELARLDIPRLRGDDTKPEPLAVWKTRIGLRWPEVTAWRREHRFGPARLRHNAATAIRAEHGLEAAQLILGHSSAVVTDAVYAERDERRIIEVARQSG